MPRSATAIRPLPELLESLRAKGLRQGVGPMAGEVPASSSPGRRGAIPSGFLALDRALGTGGWPRGSLALLDARRGSGATSLALRSLAAAQQAGGIVAWIDGPGCLDVAGAARLGVRLEWLLVAKPASVDEAVELAAWLARSGLVDATVLDLGEDPDAGSGVSAGSVSAGSGATGSGGTAIVGALDRLGKLLVRGRSVALLLPGERLGGAVGRVVSVRVALEREAWLAVGRDLVGQRVRATVTRQRWALAGAVASFDLWFAEGRRIDPLLSSQSVPQPVEPAIPEMEERPALRVLSA
jgi:recombination protein RecA